MCSVKNSNYLEGEESAKRTILPTKKTLPKVILFSDFLNQLLNTRGRLKFVPGGTEFASPLIKQTPEPVQQGTDRPQKLRQQKARRPNRMWITTIANIITFEREKQQ